jgi:hypothetical protein
MPAKKGQRFNLVLSVLSTETVLRQLAGIYDIDCKYLFFLQTHKWAYLHKIKGN